MRLTAMREAQPSSGGTREMQYKLHRVAPNSEGWTRPSKGRLGGNGVGEYVRENGFGHEDWNFNFDLASSGKMRGYTVARPAQRFLGQAFGVILATYDSSGWKAVGYYNGALFKRSVNTPEAVLRHMAADVFDLVQSGSASRRYRGKSVGALMEILRDEVQYHCWETPVQQVVAFVEPVIIPPELFSPGTQRMTCSNNISEGTFNRIIKLGDHDRTQRPERSQGQRRSMEEGDAIDDLGTDRPDRVAIRGSAYARDPKIREAVKRRAQGRCEFCDEPGFEDKDGVPYLECHHIIALANDGEDRMTNVIALCPNDHREAHFGKRRSAIEKQMIKKVQLLEHKGTGA